MSHKMVEGGEVMPKKNQEITVTATYTEGCGERLVEALLDIYYSDPETVALLTKRNERTSAAAG